MMMSERKKKFQFPLSSYRTWFGFQNLIYALELFVIVTFFFWNHIFFSVIIKGVLCDLLLACLFVYCNFNSISLFCLQYRKKTKNKNLCMIIVWYNHHLSSSLCHVILNQTFFFVPFWWFDYELLFSTIMTMMILFID